MILFCINKFKFMDLGMWVWIIGLLGFGLLDIRVLVIGLLDYRVNEFVIASSKLLGCWVSGCGLLVIECGLTGSRLG